MSEDALAIAAVTAVLKKILEDAVRDLSPLLDGDATVSALPPEHIKTKDEENSRINIFLYQVAFNQGWRNEGLPARARDGVRLRNSPLALDLYYLLTVYGRKDFDDEILLGYAMQTLHEIPVLSRELIQKILPSRNPGDNGDTEDSEDTDYQKKILKKLSVSGLADQVELIKITPHQLSTEEVSKLWSAFQVSYRPSTAYRISVILIESKNQARSALPVLKRNVTVQSSLEPQYPALQEVKPQEKQHAVRMGEILTLSGQHLEGNEVLVRFKNVRSSSIFEFPVASGSTSTELKVQIPKEPATGTADENSPMNPDNWKAGIYSVEAVVRRIEGEDLTMQERVTNELPISLAPEIKSITLNGQWEITVTCSPRVWKDQKVTLVIGDREIFAEKITADKTNTLVFKASNLPKGEQKVRLRVDGVESILIDLSGSEPVFYEGPNYTVTIT
jgi:hypothetical protein